MEYKQNQKEWVITTMICYSKPANILRITMFDGKTLSMINEHITTGSNIIKPMHEYHRTHMFKMTN